MTTLRLVRLCVASVTLLALCVALDHVAKGRRS
jgi:hypothetical protein